MERTFFFLGLPSEARRWRGFRGTYDLVSLHHARGVRDIIYFEKMFELGTIKTPIQNESAFSKS